MAIIVKGGGGKPEEEKTVTAGTSTKVVTPSDGKTIKKVTVNPTPSQSKTVTPSTLQQTVSPDSGKLLSKVIVKAMEDVTPEVTAQTPVITQIAENLGVTITTPSGTNKQILQGNNANLLDIKNNAKKEGLYVWKKLTKSIVVTFVQTSYKPITLTVSSSDIDLGTVDESWFVGIKCNYSWATAVYAFEFMENNVFVIWTADGKSHLYEGTYSYNPSNKTITTDINPSDSFGINSSVTKQGNFLDFVVSDSPTAYPDGGEQGGYWYERMKEGITPEMFGCTKMAIDTVTYSSDQSGDKYTGLRINHSLGVIPKFSILLANGNVPEIKNYIKFSITTFPNAYRGGSLSIGYSEYNGWCSEGFNSASSDYQPTPTDTYAEFKPGSMNLGFLYLKAGIEYTLITMA